MKKKKTKKILQYSKDRAVLSDTLPYETPLTFSNRHFYNFLNRYEISFNKKNKNESIKWVNYRSNKHNLIIEQIIKVLFDLSQSSVNNEILLHHHKGIIESRKIPFVYRITHKEKDFRELSIPHPKSQIELVSFYAKYKELILYYSNESPFSIRKPFSIAKFIFNNDKLHKLNKGDDGDLIESTDKEYENLKTFFTYKKYSNIYKFYEDYHYHRSEKKYNKMFKFDIAKCFDSIYTHSISWAIYNKDIVKDNVGLSNCTFSGEFDTFMQNSNYGETNGIIIGPEFSRIFAEIILQQIDKSIESELRQCEEKIYFRKDYEIYRYVDDFFVFYNDDQTKDKILSTYKLKLKEYKMSISDAKTHYYTKPLITELTIAKEKMVDLFDKKIKFTIEGSDEEDEIFCSIKFECNSNHLITRFKILVKESNVEYKDIMNYTLAIINKRIERSIKKFEKYYSALCDAESKGNLSSEEKKKKVRQENQFTSFINELLDFTFFLYTVSPRVNSTIKLSNILSEIIRYYTGKYKFKTGNALNPKEYKLFSRFDELNLNKELVFKKISDEINLILMTNKSQEHIQIETLYLFIILRELGKDYQLSEIDLLEYFKISKNHEEKLSFNFEPNYFIITVILFYIRNIKEFDNIKNILKVEIIKKITKIDNDKRKKSTEIVMLFFDILVCPFLDNKFKRKIMTLMEIPLNLQTDMINFKKEKKYWFTKWDNFNLAKELSAKKSLEVYN
ncbi:hypothetical protein J2X31_003326 [Flavobacterium arsenatis]|uniref:Reverse transcriptase domain-containing protein n=1 Tax=Flavobacterium arsenatis TaxID=1484332 RepID=A0ABU1TTV2_9FLAO|nr:antiviral reverse transcriptase Drt3b [Flavobacterium arsenatis]MDR6969296.1 hypothetical protein [Flavobacterium arsenatis]